MHEIGPQIRKAHITLSAKSCDSDGMSDGYDRQDVSLFVHFARIPFSVARLGDTMRVRFVGRWDGRWPFVARGKSGLHRVQWWVTPTLGNGWYSRCQSPTGGTVQQKVNRLAECGIRNSELGMKTLGVDSAIRISHSAFRR